MNDPGEFPMAHFVGEGLPFDEAELDDDNDEVEPDEMPADVLAILGFDPLHDDGGE